MNNKGHKSSAHKPSNMPMKGQHKGDMPPKKKVGNVAGAPDYMCGTSRCEMKDK